MRHKIVLTSVITVFLSLLIMFRVSLFIINSSYRDSNENTVQNYLDYSTSYFDGTNFEQVQSACSSTNDKVFLAFYDAKTYKIIESPQNASLFNSTEQSSVLKNYNTVKREKVSGGKILYSESVYDDGYIIYIILEKPYMSPVIRDYVIVSISILIIISIICLLVAYRFINNLFNPLYVLVSRLENLTGRKNINKRNVSSLMTQVDELEKLVANNIEEIAAEKNKMYLLINSIRQAIVVINSKKEVIIVNDYACKMFGFSREQILNKHFIFLIRDKQFQRLIDDAVEGEDIEPYKYRSNKKYYKAYFNKVSATWATNDFDEFGLALFIVDITKEKVVEKMKREFFANASHELKSPLTSILGYQEMISCKIIDTPEEIKKATDKTISEANRMNKIIIDMLELSKLESDFKNHVEKIDVKNIVLDIHESLALQAEKKNITVNLNLEEVSLEINEEHIRQLIKNLYENAIKYNVSTGNVTIILNDKYFKITDTGVGIPKSSQERIFERFYRVDKAKSKEVGGTGLGLAIVKHICNIYNFDIQLFSKVAEGTTIVVKFRK